MTEESKPRVVPIRRATESRPHGEASTVDPLPSQPPSKLDQFRELLRSTSIDPNYEVVEDRGKFRSRFGIGFNWDRDQRAALIRFKSRYDAGVNEIALLRHTGALNRSGSEIALNPSVGLALWGLVQISLFGIVLVYTAMELWPSLSSLTSNTTLSWLAVGGTTLQCVLLYLTYVYPWMLCRALSERFTDPSVLS